MRSLLIINLFKHYINSNTEQIFRSYITNDLRDCSREIAETFWQGRKFGPLANDDRG